MSTLYAWLLNLFPRAYREEYGEELQTVFDLSIDDAMQDGWAEVAGVVFREFLSLPRAIIHEHLRARRKATMMRRFNAYFNFGHGSWREFLAALFPAFLLGGVLPLMNILTSLNWIAPRGPVANGIGIALVASLGLLFVVGLIAGLPRWSLPYVGFLLSLFSAYVFSEWLRQWTHIPYSQLYQQSWFWGQVAYQGSLWIGLTAVALVMVTVIGLVPALRRFRQDWTLPGFILYGAAPFALVATFDDYVNEELYELLAFLILAAGMWLYLHSDRPRRRYLALFGGLTLSLMVAAVSKAILFSSPEWPWPRGSFSWQNELMSTVIMWMWIALSLLIPITMHFFPRSAESLPTT